MTLDRLPALWAALPAHLRALALAAAILAIEAGRAFASRVPELAVVAPLAGGAALLALAAGWSPTRLGLGRDRPALRVLGGLALAAALLLPAAARWQGGPELPGSLVAVTLVVALGQEIAYRGVLFAALEDAGGPALAVAGGTATWTIAHAFSHDPSFLPAVAGAGLLLGAWRWAAGDLVGPSIAHVLADLAL